MASNLKEVREATQKSFSSSESGHSRPCLLCLRPAPLSAHPHSQPMPLSSRRAPTGSSTSTHLPASVPGAQPSLCVDGLCAPISDEAPRWTLDSHPLAYWARPPRTPHSTINLIFSIESSPPHITSLLLSCIFKNETRDCPQLSEDRVELAGSSPLFSATLAQLSSIAEGRWRRPQACWILPPGLSFPDCKVKP